MEVEGMNMNMEATKIKDNIYCIGSLNSNLKIFEVIELAETIGTYNSYMVKGSEKTALIETVGVKFFDEYMEKLKELNINVPDVDYIIINNTEPDHAGFIERILNINPNIKIVGSKSVIEFIKHILNRQFEYIEVKNGDELALGGKTFKFIDAEFLYRPNTVYTYLAEDKMLFNSAQSHGISEKTAIKTKKEEQNIIYRWKCTVCGETVEGTEPPVVCTVCGVATGSFVKLSDEIEKILIIGASAAGISAAEEVRKINKKCEITILSKEDIKGYDRAQLSKILSKNISLDALTIKNNLWFKENNINLYLNKEVSGIDIENKKIVLTDNSEIGFTKLIIASGAECTVPPIGGNDKKGVFTLRYIKDCVEIREYVKDKKYAAVIGGGVLGIETASELSSMGLEVTVIEMAERILPIHLDSQASLILEKLIKNAGIKIKKGALAKEIVGDDEAAGVLLEDGELIKADIVILSAGIKANSRIAQGAGIEIKEAIVVNDKMETSIDDVYACGDCCEHNGVNFALWNEAKEQGKTAGINSVGGKYVYEQIMPSISLNIFNISVLSTGDIGSDSDTVYQVNEIKDPNGKNYKKMYFSDGRFVGGIQIGDTYDQLYRVIDVCI
ncbi:MAG: FAD-dependent oxidoreductase [Tissierellia bacterium]|nr:FAD-dependent oxidoreductase [Tissierellia bacterium]